MKENILGHPVYFMKYSLNNFVHLEKPVACFCDIRQFSLNNMTIYSVRYEYDMILGGNSEVPCDFILQNYRG